MGISVPAFWQQNYEAAASADFPQFPSFINIFQPLTLGGVVELQDHAMKNANSNPYCQSLLSLANMES